MTANENSNPLPYWSGLADDAFNKESEINKLSEEVYGKDVNQDYEEGFVDGYNKAKETLYTEEEVRKAIRLTHSSHRRYLDFLEDDIIQSLKQK